MALSLETTVLPGAIDGGFPSGYSAPSTSHTFTSADKEENETWTIAASGVTNATASTGLTALVSAVDTYCSGTYVGSELGLDVSGNTVNMICTIRSITRAITAASIFNPGTDNFTVKVNIQYEIS